MKADDDVLSLANIGQGAAIEKFDLELERCLKNILDPNTESGPRDVVLKVTLKPNEKRNLVEIEVHCKSNLKPLVSFTTAAAIGRSGGQVEARELVQRPSSPDRANELGLKTRRFSRSGGAPC